VGCGCQGQKKNPPPEKVSTGGTATFSLKLDTAGRHDPVFGSRLEAEAARVRLGGAGRVVQSPPGYGDSAV
jgi:hypothetical protein